MVRYILLAICWALLGVHLALGQGTRKLRYTFSLTPVYRDSSYYNAPKIYILSTTDKYQVTGVLNVPFKSLSYQFSVDPLGMFKISLPSSSVGYTTGASDTTITIEANGDVVVYGYSEYPGYQDSFYVIPLKHTGMEYYVASYNPYTSSSSYAQSYFAITSFSDNTDINIYFTQQYSYNEELYDRDNPLNLTLNAFESFLLETQFDLTGTFLNSGRDFVVSCGHGYTRTGSSGVDAIVEFPPPVKGWGTYFLVTKFRSQTSYTLRILASQSDTLVTFRTIGLNDTSNVTIQPGSFHEKSLVTSSLEVFSSAPVMVVQYMTSLNPSMTTVPPLDRAINGPLYLNSLESSYIDVTVWFSSDDDLNLRVNGDLVQWEKIITNQSGWSVVQAGLERDKHILSHSDSSVKMAALAYYDGSSHPLMYFTHEENDIDNQAPFVACPEGPIMAEMPPNEEVVAVYWNPPEVSDNSGLEVKTESSHSPGDLFQVGSTTVTYTFEDVSGNVAHCQFEVFVADVSPPMILYCPSNIEIATCANGAEISWDEPQFSDASDNVNFNRSHRPGDMFIIGNTPVSYVFSDPSGNEAICNFVVTIDPNVCQASSVIGLIVAMSIFSLAIVCFVIVIVYLSVKKVKS